MTPLPLGSHNVKFRSVKKKGQHESSRSLRHLTRALFLPRVSCHFFFATKNGKLIPDTHEPDAVSSAENEICCCFPHWTVKKSHRVNETRELEKELFPSWVSCRRLEKGWAMPKIIRKVILKTARAFLGCFVLYRGRWSDVGKSGAWLGL